MNSMSYGMRLHVSQDQRERKSGGGKHFSLRLSLDTMPTRLHFSLPTKLYKDIETGYEFPYKKGRRHYIPTPGGKGRGVYVECGPQCVVCAYTDPQRLGVDVEVNNNLSKHPPESYYAVSGWVEELHHRVVYSRKDGDGTFTRRERCTGKGCQFCTDHWPKVFGNKFFFLFSKAAWDNAIFGVQQQAERYCRCGNGVYIPDYVCGNCQTPIFEVCSKCDCGSEQIAIDLENGRAVCQACQAEWFIFASENPAILEQASTVVACANCKTTALPMPHFVCSSETCTCDPLNVFDCQITLKKESADQKAKIIVAHSAIGQEPDPKLFDPKYQGLDQGNDKAAEDAEWMKDPLNLEEILAADSPHIQAQALGVNNPFGGGGASSKPSFRPYIPKKAEPSAQG